MSKSSLIIDTPKYCYLCSCYAEYEDVGYCQGVTVKRVPTEGKPSWCPLKPYKKVDAIPIDYIEKWIDARTRIIKINPPAFKELLATKLLDDWLAGREPDWPIKFEVEENDS